MGMFEDIIKKRKKEDKYYSPNKVNTNTLTSATTKNRINELRNSQDETSQSLGVALNQREREREIYIGDYLRQNKLDGNIRNINKASNEFDKNYDEIKRKQQERLEKNYSNLNPGYELGDFTKGLVATTSDLGLDILEGGLGYLEGVTDWATYRTADAADFLDRLGLGIGIDTESMRKNADFNSVATLFGKNTNLQQNILGDWTSGIEKASYSPEFVDQIAQGIGQIGMAGAGGLITGGSSLGTAAITYASSYGNARSEAIRNGATDEEARKAAIIHGVAETISEQIFAGIPGMKVEGWGSKLNGKISDAATKYFGSNAGKVALKVLDSAGEGTEEIISNILVAVGSDITHSLDNNYNYGMEGLTGNALEDILDQVTSKDSWQQFFSAAISSAIVNGGKAIIDTKTQNKIINAYAKDNGMSFKDAKYILTGQLDNNEQVLTEREKKEFDSQVELEEAAKQRVLNYMQSTQGQEIESRIQQEVAEREQQAGIQFTDEQRNQLTTDIRSKYVDIVNSPDYYTQFTQEAKTKKDKELVKLFQDANMDNTQNSHEIFDFIKNLQDNNKKAKFNLVNNQMLEQQGFNIKDENGNYKTINGFYKDGVIHLNKNAKNPYQQVVYHEIGHAIKESNAQLYDDMKKLVYELKGKERLAEYRELYNVKEGEIASDLTDNVEDEYVNDMLGEILESDKFINTFQDNRTLLQKILDKLKELISNITSSEQKKHFKEIETKLQNLYKQGYEKAKFKGSEQAAFSLDENLKPKEEVSLSYAKQRFNRNMGKYSIGDNLEDAYLEHQLRKDELDSLYEYAKKKAYNDNELRELERRYNELIERENPSQANEIKYSLTDSNGKELSQEQQEYFKDSKVRDSEGRLLEVYHGSVSNEQINIFDTNALPVRTRTGVQGTYFTSNGREAQNYRMVLGGDRNSKGTFYKAYLNITNPLDITNDIAAFQKQGMTFNEAKQKALEKLTSENDGIIFKGNNINSDEYVVFKSEQIKSVDNTNPTSNPDIRYSLSQDSQGRELSKEQQDFFKDSKIRDTKGRLIPMYHGTQGDFNVFDFKNYGGKNGVAEGFGIYLTDNKQVADDYGGRVIEAYANVTKPASSNKLTTTQQELVNCIKELSTKEAQIMVDNGDYDNINDALKDTWISNYTYTYDKTIDQSYNDVAKQILNSSESDAGVIQELMNGSGNNDYKLADEFYNTITNTLGFDGLETQWDFSDDAKLQNKSANIVLAFRSNQIKNVDNLNPTENEDIRYSLGTETNQPTGFENTELFTTTEDYLRSIGRNLDYLQQISTTDDNLPFYTGEEETPKTIAERMSIIRQKLADDRFTKIMDKQTYKSIKDSTRMAKSYLDFDTNQTNEFKNQISKLAKLPKDKLIKAKNYNQLKDIISKYAKKDMTFVNQELKSAQKDVRNTQLIVSQELKDQITDWSDFRKRSGLNIRIGQKSNVDTTYQELLDTYPGMLDSTITNYADQLQELSEFVKRDNKYVEHYELNDDAITQITNKVWEKLSKNALTQQEINDIQADIQMKAERRTREVVREDLLDRMGLTIDDIAQGKDISALAYQRTDPNRLNEKVFGYEVGQKINQATAGFVKQQEAQKIRFLNKERNEIKELGIKARSKESAAVQKYGEKQYVNNKGELVDYTEQDLMSEFKDEAKVQQIKIAAEVLRQKYDRYIDMINGSLTEMGYDAIPKRQDYFKHFMELQDKLSQFGWVFSKENIMKEDLPTDINGLTDQFKPGKNYFASALQRKGLKTTYDAITGIDSYLEGASDLIFHTESIQRYRALSKLIRDTYGQQHGLEDLELMTPEEAQQRIQDVYDNKLTKYAAWLDEQANALAGKKAAIDRSVERFIGRRGYTLLNALKKQVGSNMTGFNVRSSLTNFASAIQGASKTEKLSALQGFAFALKNYRNIDPLVAKSDFLATRFGSDALSKKTWQKMSEAGQVFMNASDRFTSLQIWGGKYYEGLHHGLTEQAAIQQADDFASRIMGDRSKGQTAEIFNSKTLGFLTQFQLEVNNQWSSMIHDNKMVAKQNPGLKAGLHIANQLGQLYVASWVFNNLMKALTGTDVMIDPIDLLLDLFNPDDEDKSLEDRTTDMIGKVVNQLPMASIFTGGRIPISEAFKGAETGFKYVTGQTDTYGNKYTLEDVRDDFIGSFAYYLLPTGYGQIRKTAQGLGMYANELPGSYTSSGRLRFEADTSPLGMLQAAVFGQYASGNAREYFDNGYSPLTEKQQEEVKEMNLPVSEYRQIKADIKQQDGNENKIDYIYNLPLSDNQKNVLANGTLNRKKDVDISNYGDYGSLEEFDYANKNPEKYVTIQQITDYDNYQTYKDEIANIKKQYSNTEQKKKAVFNYINGLPMNQYQKLMLQKMAGGYSIKNYESQLQNYINSLDLTKEEKQNIDKELF